MALISKKMDCFIAVAQEGSLSQVAKKKNMTSSPISRLITELERELGILLFNRQGAGMKLTNEGERFYNEIIYPYSLMKSIEKHCIAKNKIKIEVCGPFPIFMEDLCHFLFKPNENKFIEVSRFSYEEIKKMPNEFDIIYTTEVLPGMNEYELYCCREDVFILTSSKLELDEVFKMPFIQNSAFSQTNAYINIHREMVKLGYSHEMISIDCDGLCQEAINDGLGISLATRHLIRSIDPKKVTLLTPRHITKKLNHNIYIKKIAFNNHEKIINIISRLYSLPWEKSYQH